jgi:hypothetical protein
LRFLHAVFAEHALAGFEQRLDGLGGMGLADSDQRDLARLASGDLASVDNASANRFEPCGCAFHGPAL